MLQIITRAFDLNLLTIEELRAAVGLESDDASQDDKLYALGSRVSSMITAACRVPGDGVVPATLLQEGCRDTFRLTSCNRLLFLSRRPVAQVTSVTENGTELVQDVDYEFDAAGGTLTRLSGDNVSEWACGKIVVEYDAGFAEVPEDLKALAQQLAGGYWADDGVDPMEKSLTIPDVIETQRWVDQNADAQMPADISNALSAGGYIYRTMIF